MRNRNLVLGIGLLLIAATVLSCARVFPPAEPEMGPTPTPAPPPPIATHAAPPGETDCLVCHESDPLFIAALERDHPIPYPPGFKGTAREACEVCHEMGTAHAATNPIPHPIEGMGECSTCHASGAEGIAQMPADHVGRTDTMCSMCHAAGVSAAATAPIAAMAIPHPVEGRKNCLTCHKDGMPADHKDRTNATCTTCHSSPVVEPIATPAPSAAEPSPTAAVVTAPPAVAMAIPHPVEGREDCLVCHKNGMPADHKDRTNATCTMCHAAPAVETPTTVPAKPSPTATAVPVATPTAGAVQLGPSPTPAAMPTSTVAPTAAATATPAPVVEGPAPIPHALAGMERCQTCHASGAAAFPQSPANHAEYDVSLCIFCHAPPEGTAPPAEQPSDVPHVLAGMEGCRTCHASGAAAFPQVPENHTGFDNSVCAACHAVK